jgi:hypothetical protein
MTLTARREHRRLGRMDQGALHHPVPDTGAAAACDPVAVATDVEGPDDIDDEAGYAGPRVLYVWRAGDELDADAADTLVDRWLAAGGNPAASPFEPSTDVAWFFKELTEDLPALDARSDAARGTGGRPIWLSTEDPPPARVVVIQLDPDTAREDLHTIMGIAAKYDLALFDPSGPRILRPLELLGELASRDFWPRGAIQAFVAGMVGLAIAWLGWYLGIPIVNAIAMLAGGFMFVMAVLTFVYEGWRTLGRRGSRGRAGG